MPEPTISPTDYPYPGLPGHYLWRAEWEDEPMMVQVRVNPRDDGTFEHKLFSVDRGEGIATEEPWSQGFWTMVYTTPDDLAAIVTQVLNYRNVIELLEHARDTLETRHELLQASHDKLQGLYDAAVLDIGKLASRLSKEHAAFSGPKP